MRSNVRILSIASLLAVSLGASWPIHGAEPVRVAAAASLRYALEEVREKFRENHPDTKVEIIFGSSGKLAAQIENGAPFDLFYSADVDAPRRLHEKGLCATPPQLYAHGRLVVWSPARRPEELTVAALASPGVRKIAVANPRLAPYGDRALQALRRAGVFADVEPRLVYGENVSQAAQMVESGGAEAGLVAYSLVLNPALGAEGSYALVPEDLHDPLEQAFCLLRRAAGSPVARAFASFSSTPAARTVFQRHGFLLPGEEDSRLGGQAGPASPSVLDE